MYNMAGGNDKNLYLIKKLGIQMMIDESLLSIF